MVQVYFILRVYCAHIERILVLRVLAVRAVLTDEILPALAVPAVQDPEILGSAGSIHSNEPTTDSGSIRRTYRTPKKCEYGSIQKYKGPKYSGVLAVLTVLKPEILRVLEILRVPEIPREFIYQEDFTLLTGNGTIWVMFKRSCTYLVYEHLVHSRGTGFNTGCGVLKKSAKKESLENNVRPKSLTKGL